MVRLREVSSPYAWYLESLSKLLVDDPRGPRSSGRYDRYDDHRRGYGRYGERDYDRGYGRRDDRRYDDRRGYYPREGPFISPRHILQVENNVFCFSQSRSDDANLSLQTATTMAHALTDMVAVEAETTATIAVEVEEDTMIVMIETPVAPATHPQLPVTVIQHLLGSLTVAATLMRDTPVESSDC